MRRAKSTKFSHQYFDIIDECAQEVGISFLEGDVILDEHFKDIKDFLEDPRSPGVSINSVLCFKPAIWKIRKKIKHLIGKRRSGKIDKEKFETELRRLWKIKTRLYKEKSGDGKSTYYKWNNKKADKFVEDLKKDGNK